VAQVILHNIIKTFDCWTKMLWVASQCEKPLQQVKGQRRRTHFRISRSVARLDGARARLVLPCSNLISFGSKINGIQESNCDIVGTSRRLLFGRSFGAYRSNSAPNELCSPRYPPAYTEYRTDLSLNFTQIVVFKHFDQRLFTCLAPKAFSGITFPLNIFEIKSSPR